MPEPLPSPLEFLRTAQWTADGCEWENMGDPVSDIRARIASAAPDALRLLLAIESSTGCPTCGARETNAPPDVYRAREGHAEGCEWLRVMRKAGLR